MKRTPGAGIAMGGVLVLAMATAESRAQDVNEEHLLGHALRYAGMIERAFGRLHGHIRNRSLAVTSWSGAAIPPGETRWESIWTDAGLRARYCEDVLVVYMSEVEPKGVGNNHRAIQQARRSYLPERARGVRLPMLSWLEGGEVTDSQGNTLILPDCMTANYTEPMPSGRAALWGVVADPWTNTSERVSYENRTSACPAGNHGEVRERRQITQEFNDKGEPAGPPVFGTWEESPGSRCRSDYMYDRLMSQECSWDQGPPFNRTMRGTATFRAEIQVTADPENPIGGVKEIPDPPSADDWELVSTTCWGGPIPTPPTPTTNVVNEVETRTLACPTGFEGSIAEARTKTTATTTYPDGWNEDPLVSDEYTNWSETSNTCTAIDDGGQDGPEGNSDGPDGNEGGQETDPVDDGRDEGSNMDADAVTGNADPDHSDNNGNNSADGAENTGVNDGPGSM